jgi:peptidyl-tRNA hydrolase, PTH1 family
MSLRLIVGLGNPGKEYAETRHNAGMWFVEKLAEKYNANLRNETKFHGFLASIDADRKMLCPTTFMNLSGQAVQAVASYYKIAPNEILVAHDELDFLPGIIRLKFGGGHGGHNGLSSIIDHLGSKDFYRLRIGIGHPGNKNLVSDYVLNNPGKEDKKLIINSIERAIEIIQDLFDGKFELAQQKLNTAIDN